MKVIFVSATCAREDYNLICQKRKRAVIDSSQKFFEMFLDGLVDCDDVNVDCISVPPISRSTYPGIYIKAKQNRVKGINYFYTSVVNFPILKTIFATSSAKRRLKKLLKSYSNEQVKIICDPLLLEGLVPTVKLGKKYKISTIGFLTDMPKFASENDKMGFLKKCYYNLYNKSIDKNLKKLDKYIVLTPAMSYVAEDKPWLLVDCFVEQEMLKDIEPIKYEDDMPHVVYAGKLHEKFGLDILCETIPLVKTNCVFDIYGDGNFMSELKKLAQNFSNIKLHGIVPLKVVLCAEISCQLLINPRTSKGEFTKYSFPSKTAEYMLAGVPLVMFRLPGISSQYNDYIKFAQDESPQAFADKIDEVLSLTKEERHQIGRCAKDFIVENKNNKKQAKRILGFLCDKR